KGPGDVVVVLVAGRGRIGRRGRKRDAGRAYLDRTNRVPASRARNKTDASIARDPLEGQVEAGRIGAVGLDGYVSAPPVDDPGTGNHAVRENAGGDGVFCGQAVEIGPRAVERAHGRGDRLDLPDGVVG